MLAETDEYVNEIVFYFSIFSDKNFTHPQA